TPEKNDEQQQGGSRLPQPPGQQRDQPHQQDGAPDERPAGRTAKGRNVDRLERTERGRALDGPRRARATRTARIPRARPVWRRGERVRPSAPENGGSARDGTAASPPPSKTPPRCRAGFRQPWPPTARRGTAPPPHS